MYVFRDDPYYSKPSLPNHDLQIYRGKACYEESSYPCSRPPPPPHHLSVYERPLCTDHKIPSVPLSVYERSLYNDRRPLPPPLPPPSHPSEWIRRDLDVLDDIPQKCNCDLIYAEELNRERHLEEEKCCCTSSIGPYRSDYKHVLDNNLHSPHDMMVCRDSRMYDYNKSSHHDIIDRAHEDARHRSSVGCRTSYHRYGSSYERLPAHYDRVPPPHPLDHPHPSSTAPFYCSQTIDDHNRLSYNSNVRSPYHSNPSSVLCVNKACSPEYSKRMLPCLPGSYPPPTSIIGPETRYVLGDVKRKQDYPKKKTSERTSSQRVDKSMSKQLQDATQTAPPKQMQEIKRVYTYLPQTPHSPKRKPEHQPIVVKNNENVRVRVSENQIPPQQVIVNHVQVSHNLGSRPTTSEPIMAKNINSATMVNEAPPRQVIVNKNLTQPQIHCNLMPEKTVLEEGSNNTGVLIRELTQAEIELITQRRINIANNRASSTGQVTEPRTKIQQSTNVMNNVTGLIPNNSQNITQFPNECGTLPATQLTTQSPNYVQQIIPAQAINLTTQPASSLQATNFQPQAIQQIPCNNKITFIPNAVIPDTKNDGMTSVATHFISPAVTSVMSPSIPSVQSPSVLSPSVSTVLSPGVTTVLSPIDYSTLPSPDSALMSIQSPASRQISTDSKQSANATPQRQLSDDEYIKSDKFLSDVAESLTKDSIRSLSSAVTNLPIIQSELNTSSQSIASADPSQPQVSTLNNEVFFETLDNMDDLFGIITSKS